MEYLLLLQNLRQAAPHWLNESILFFSEFVGGVGGLAVMALIYWGVNKRLGTLLLMNYSLAYVCNTVTKNLLRVPRPFERDLRLTPYVPATGYSFPSGHTMLAAAFYGTLAHWNRKRRGLALLFVLLGLLAGFTRNWLGAHTAEDVVVGILLSCGVIAVSRFLLEWVDRAPGRDGLLLAGGLVGLVLFCVAFPSGAKPAGIWGGVMLGRYLEGRFLRFEPAGSLTRRAGLCLPGLLLVAACYKLILPALLAPLGGWAGGISNFITFLMVTAGWPAVMKRAGEKGPDRAIG